MATAVAILGFACTFLSGDLCVPAPYDATVDILSMIAYSDLKGNRLGPSKAAIRDLGVEVFVIESDNFVDTRPGGLPQACAGDVCVLYHKHCSIDGLKCLYEWGLAPAPTAPGAEPKSFFTKAFRIEARSLAALRRAEGALFFTLGTGPGAQRLPVAALDQLSPEEDAPSCPIHRVVPDCPDLTDRDKRIRAYGGAP